MGWLTSLRRWLPRSLAPVQAIEEVAWRALVESSDLFARLDADRAQRLRALAARFLARKSFSAAGGHALNDQQCLAIAALACLPVVDLGFDWLDGWTEVIVYPGEFRVRREHHDERTGVVTEGDEDIIGEAWEHGPLIVSWADVAADLQNPFDGFNVVVHEVAHKLDMLDGAMNGVPRLPRSISRREWVATMQSAYDAFLRAIDAGEDTAIDPYAAESADEFFAVLCEQFFSDPAVLREAMPDPARMLARLFSQANRAL